MSFHLDYLLDLPGVTVETCSCIENQFTLQVRIVAEGINCPHCGQFTQELHQNRPILARDLSTFGKAVYLKVPRRQFYCAACQRYSTETVEWIDWKRHYPQRYEEYVYGRIKVTSMEQVSRAEGLGVEVIQVLFDPVSAQRKNTWDSVSESRSMKLPCGRGIKILSLWWEILSKAIDSKSLTRIVARRLLQSCNSNRWRFAAKSKQSVAICGMGFPK